MQDSKKRGYLEILEDVKSAKRTSKKINKLKRALDVISDLLDKEKRKFRGKLRRIFAENLSHLEPEQKNAINEHIRKIGNKQ